MDKDVELMQQFMILLIIFLVIVGVIVDYCGWIGKRLWYKFLMMLAAFEVNVLQNYLVLLIIACVIITKIIHDYGIEGIIQKRGKSFVEYYS